MKRSEALNRLDEVNLVLEEGSQKYLKDGNMMRLAETRTIQLLLAEIRSMVVDIKELD